MSGRSHTRAVVRGSWDRVAVVLALIALGVVLDRCDTTRVATDYSQGYSHWEAGQ